MRTGAEGFVGSGRCLGKLTQAVEPWLAEEFLRILDDVIFGRLLGAPIECSQTPCNLFCVGTAVER
jgi:hypothetical protein